ncbi:MAG: hypothetical protein ACRENJ_09940, partial [Candidatus Eiseniibacteriota bacterium]
MKLLALDLGTRTGWALSSGAGLESGVQAFDLKRGESPGMRYIRFRRWLEEVGAGVELIVYEAAHHRGGAATEIAAGLTTRVQEFCAGRGLEHASVHTATLKKWTTGKGNADKVAMLEAVARRWKPCEDDNEADAVALLYYA